MKKKIIICFCISFLHVSLQGQSTGWTDISKENMAKVFEQISNWYKQTTDYTVTVTHASFENHTTGIPYEKSTGYFKKEKENYHSFLLNVHTIQNLKYKIVLDSIEKTMMVSNINQSIWEVYMLEDYAYVLKSCKEIKMAAVQHDKRYRLIYNEGFPLEKYEFLMAADGSLKEVVMYYSKKVPKDENNPDSEMVKPRLSITFSAYKKGILGTGTNEFDEKNYFIKKGNKLVPTGKYKNYTLSDQRLKLD